MKQFLFLFLAIIIACNFAFARKIKTSRSSGPAVVNATSSPSVDTIVDFSPQLLLFSGYDKPVRASRETFFLTNQADTFLHGVALTIEYFDLQNRQLHKRQRNVIVDIPQGETRQLSIPSWDKQQSFYYYQSNPPRRIKAYPYKVKITADTLFLSR